MTFTSQHPDSCPPRWARFLLELWIVSAIAAIAVIGVRSLTTWPPSATTPALVATGPVDLCESVDDAYLSGTLYGALDRAIEWRGTDMRCEGGPRPDGDGMRLVFTAPGDGEGNEDGDRLVFVIGISGALEGLTDVERVANVTVIDASSGRFFSSGRQERCWTTVTSVSEDNGHTQIGGELYCAGSLPSMSDGSSISLGDFRYSGRLIFDAP